MVALWLPPMALLFSSIRNKPKSPYCSMDLSSSSFFFFLIFRGFPNPNLISPTRISTTSILFLFVSSMLLHHSFPIPAIKKTVSSDTISLEELYVRVETILCIMLPRISQASEDTWESWERMSTPQHHANASSVSLASQFAVYTISSAEMTVKGRKTEISPGSHIKPSHPAQKIMWSDRFLPLLRPSEYC